MKTIALSLSSLCLFACASADTTAVRYDNHTAGATDEPRVGIELEDRVADACDLPRGTTYFAYESTELDRMDDAALERVATCMKTGKLHRADVVVIGYTDPRGTKTDNRDLGMTRAETVADALVTHGVAKSRLYIKSVGERAAGDSRTEADWAADRKVTLRIAERD